MNVLITGASSGIGLELARIFAEHGNDLILVARSAEKLEALAAELRASAKIRVRVIPKDLSTPTSVDELLVEIGGDQIDILVNNAGFGGAGRFATTDLDKELQMIALNITTLTILTKRVLPAMIARRSGRILNVASTAAFQPGPLMAVYYATKAYVLSLSEAIANELDGTGVTVTALCPGPTVSGFQEAAGIEQSRLTKGRRLPTSREVAEYGYISVMSGTTVAVHGLLNRLLVFSVRISPRKMVASIVRFLNDNRGK